MPPSFLQDRKSNSTSSPTRWDHRTVPGTRAHDVGNSRYLEVSGLRVRYTGPGAEDSDAASVRADHCVPFGVGLFYYEIEVLNKGQNGFVGIGFSTADVKLERLPGWEPHSYGYHGDDGHSFNHSGKGVPYGPTFGTGDYIGVIYNKVDRTIAFTKNGVHLGVAFRNVYEERLYPTVGMRTPDEEIVANFGGSPFKGDVDSIMAGASQTVEWQISNSVIPSDKKDPGVAEQLVFEYLRHQGYWETAAAAGPSLMCNPSCVSEGDLREAQLRKQVCAAIQDADIERAIRLVEPLAPLLLAKLPGLNFKLQCQRFMEMIRMRRPEEALKFGLDVLGPTAKSASEQELLQEALTLVAHVNPEDCPNYHELLGEEAHTQLAEEVNAAILRYHGRSERSCLETLIRQAVVLKAELQDQGNPAISLLDLSKYSLGKRKTT